MANCEYGNYIGKNITQNGRVFEIENLEVEERNAVSKEMSRITGINFPIFARDEKAKCLVQETLEEDSKETHSYIGSQSTTAGICHKCGNSVWVLVKRIS